MDGGHAAGRVRARPLCPPYGLNWCQKFKTDCYPWPADLTSWWQICGIFPQNRGGRVFHAMARRHASAMKKPRLAARKTARIPVAFSSPQELHIELMFGAARFGERALSALRGLNFHIAPRRR